MYLEQRVEELERQMREFKEQKKSEQYLSPKEFAEKMSCSQSFENRSRRGGSDREKEGTEQSWKDIVFKGA